MGDDHDRRRLVVKPERDALPTMVGEQAHRAVSFGACRARPDEHDVGVGPQRHQQPLVSGADSGPRPWNSDAPSALKIMLARSP